jgi:hypothetical protein
MHVAQGAAPPVAFGDIIGCYVPQESTACSVSYSAIFYIRAIYIRELGII